MRIFFQNVDSTINGTGILAESAAISSRNSVQPVYAVGKIGQRGQAPFGPLTSTFQFNYIPELNSEPNIDIRNLIINLTGDHAYSGVQLVIGGMTGSNCYLQRLGIEADTNEPVKASVAFSTFTPVSGQPSVKTGTTSYNAKNAYAHGWSVHIQDTGNSQSTPTYNFSYGLDVQWEPVYIMGQTKPANVKLMAARETVAFSRDVARNILHSGENLSGFLDGTTGDMRLLDITFSCSSDPDTTLPSIRIPLSGFTIIESDVSANLNDFLHVRSLATRGY